MCSVTGHELTHAETTAGLSEAEDEADDVSEAPETT